MLPTSGGNVAFVGMGHVCVDEKGGFEYGGI